MTLENAINELQKIKNEDTKNLKVCFDFGACEVKKISVDTNFDVNCKEYKYIHLDWCE